MEYIKDKKYDQERAFYGSCDIELENCCFDGPADGESAFKESRNIKTTGCLFNLRYPFWHCSNINIDSCEMTELCRAALWYTNNIAVENTQMLGIKALRECDNISIKDCVIQSPEFGWLSKNIKIENSKAQGEYFMFNANVLDFNNVTLKGKYSFQYITDSKFNNCNFDTKDAFWHAKNIVVKDCVIKGEYLAWYSENITFENCVIEGTQPFCYCKGLKLINCEMKNADLAFEKSDVEADITTPVISIKNPVSGMIKVPKVYEIILDQKTTCKIIVGDTEI